MLRVVKSLDVMPGRFGVARERRVDRVQIRQVVFKSHRIIFSIEQRKKR